MLSHYGDNAASSNHRQHAGNPLIKIPPDFCIKQRDLSTMQFRERYAPYLYTEALLDKTLDIAFTG